MSEATEVTSHILQLMNSGPIHEASLVFERGINLIKGDHGAGKSTVINVLERRFGAGEADITVRDGEEKGTCKWNGETVLTLGKVCRRTGKVELKLSSSYPFSRLVDPGFELPETNNKARVAAYLELVRIAVNDETIKTLAGADEDALNYIDSKIGLEKLAARDIVGATEGVRLAIHELKRTHETEVTRAELEIEGLNSTIVKPDKLSNVSVEDAAAALDLATRKHERLSGEAGQRAARELERKQILELNEVEPNLEGAKDRVTEAYQKKVECARLVAEAEHALELAQVNAQGANLAHTQSVKALERLESDAKTYYERKTILESEITGATDEDVAAAQMAVDEATTALEGSRASALFREQLVKKSDARTRLDQHKQEAKRFEGLATGVTGRLSQILAATGSPGVTIDDSGELCVVHEDGRLEPFARLSYGQRTRRGVEWFAKSSEAGSVLTIDWKFWAALNEAMQMETQQIIWDADLVAAVEVASSGELRVEHFQVEEMKA